MVRIVASLSSLATTFQSDLLFKEGILEKIGLRFGRRLSCLYVSSQQHCQKMDNAAELNGVDHTGVAREKPVWISI